LQIEEQKRQVLRRVAGRVQCLQPHSAKLQDVAVAQRPVRHRIAVQLALVISAQGKLRSSGLRQRRRTSGEVGMDVGLQNIAEAEVILRGVCCVAVDVADRIDRDGLALRRNHIGVLRQPWNLKSFNLHVFPSRGHAP
jgi:hypothetical protein